MNDKKIIIKKKIKRYEDEHHGGAWKVAYSDFMTAMMAFFMLLWLISMISPEKKAAVARYFKQFSVFQPGSHSFMSKSNSIVGNAGSSASRITLQLTNQNPNLSGSPVQMAQMLKHIVNQKLGDVKDQIRVDVIKDGVRIQIMDKNGSPLFDSGSVNPTPAAHRIMSVIGQYLKDSPNEVALEGHTDALPYVNGKRDNWDLSIERALAARALLVADGLDESHIARITGYGSTVPLVKDDPLDPKNRRISVIVLFKHAPGPGSGH